MLHVFSCAALMGRPGAMDLVDHGIKSLLDGPLADKKYGGRYVCVSNDGTVAKDPAK